MVLSSPGDGHPPLSLRLSQAPRCRRRTSRRAPSSRSRPRSATPRAVRRRSRLPGSGGAVAEFSRVAWRHCRIRRRICRHLAIMSPQFFEASAYARFFPPGRVDRTRSRCSRGYGAMCAARCTAPSRKSSSARASSSTASTRPPSGYRDDRRDELPRLCAEPVLFAVSRSHRTLLRRHHRAPGCRQDLSIVEALGEELTLHHTRSPIFNPYVQNPAGRSRL